MKKVLYLGAWWSYKTLESGQPEISVRHFHEFLDKFKGSITSKHRFLQKHVYKQVE